MRRRLRRKGKSSAFYTLSVTAITDCPSSSSSSSTIVHSTQGSSNCYNYEIHTSPISQLTVARRPIIAKTVGIITMEPKTEQMVDSEWMQMQGAFLYVSLEKS